MANAVAPSQPGGIDACELAAVAITQAELVGWAKKRAGGAGRLARQPRDRGVVHGHHAPDPCPGFSSGLSGLKEAEVRLTADRQPYDHLQCHILQQITDAVRGQLNHLLLSRRVPADLNSATTDIVFSVGSIIDGSEEVEDRGTPVIPALAFATTDARDELVFAGLGYCDATIEEFLGRPAPFPRESVYRTSFNATEHVALAQVGAAGVFREH
jgi:hypothetical protein